MKRLIINPIGGLANRMRAIASGLELAHHTGRKGEIIWPVDNDLRCPYEKLFEVPEDFPPIKDIGSWTDRLFYDVPRKRNLYLSPLFRLGKKAVRITDIEIRTMDFRHSRELEEKVKRTKEDVMIRSGLDFFPADDGDYPRLFRPKTHIMNEAKTRSGGKRMIGLHIRRTDNGMAIRHSPVTLFEKTIEKEIAADGNVVFYLATDEPTLKKKLKERYGSQRIVCSDLPAVRDSEEGMTEALTEMMTLSLCEKIYGSYWSSFSEAAALLGQIPLMQLCTKQQPLLTTGKHFRKKEKLF